MKSGNLLTKHRVALLLLALLTAGCGSALDDNAPRPKIITIIGTNDFHGALQPLEGYGGLSLFSAHLEYLRDMRKADGGAVILLDAGDTWQGTLESNIMEGASVVNTYELLEYSAVAIGNHDFDFGPVGPRSTPSAESDDPRGALKQRIQQAQYPTVAANIIDESTGLPIDWPGVTPSVILPAAGLKIGIIGGITMSAPITTFAANVEGLQFTPMAEAIEREAGLLRLQEVDLVIVVTHAGGKCMAFDDPDDLTHCNTDDEIFGVANALPHGSVDVIIGGHAHEGIAHNVNGIAVISAYSDGRAFGRIDVAIDPTGIAPASRTIHAPQHICDSSNDSHDCLDESRLLRGAVPEALSQAIEDAYLAVEESRTRLLGANVGPGFHRTYETDGPIGNLLTDIMLESTDGADIAVQNTVGGIRSDLPAGPVTYGDVYEVFPFDNRVVTLSLTGRQLRDIFLNQFQGDRRRAGIAGFRVFAECRGPTLDITMIRNDGRVIMDEQRLTVATTDFLATGGDDVFGPVIPDAGFELTGYAPYLRDLIVDWLTAREEIVLHDEFFDPGNRRFVYDRSPPIVCSGQLENQKKSTL